MAGDSTFYPIPAVVASRTDIGFPAKILYGYLVYRRGDKVDAWPGAGAARRDLGMERKAFFRAVDQLESAGLCSVERRHGAVNRYQPCDPNDTKPVPKRDQSQNGTSPKTGLDQSQNGTTTSPKMGPESEPLNHNQEEKKKARSPRIGQIDFPKATAEAVTEAVTGLPASTNGNGRVERRSGPLTGPPESLPPEVYAALEALCRAEKERFPSSACWGPNGVKPQRITQTEDMVDEWGAAAVLHGLKCAAKAGTSWGKTRTAIAAMERSSVYAKIDAKRRQSKPQPPVHLDDPRRYHKQEAEG